MKSNTIKIFVLLLSTILFACGGGETETTSDTNAETSETVTETEGDLEAKTSDSENSGESTSSDLPEVGKGISYYAAQYEEKFLKGIFEGAPVGEVQVEREADDAAGYAAFRWNAGVGGNNVVNLGLWVTTEGREMIGVFSYIFGGMSQGAEPAALRFYATDWTDITEEVVNITELEELSQSVREVGAINQFIADIPKSGTSIKVSESTMDGEVELGELQFDGETGKFTLVKK